MLNKQKKSFALGSVSQPLKLNKSSFSLILTLNLFFWEYMMNVWKEV